MPPALPLLLLAISREKSWQPNKSSLILYGLNGLIYLIHL